MGVSVSGFCHTRRIRCECSIRRYDMIIDCDRCVMSGTGACADCVVPVLFSSAADRLELGSEEQDALRNLADAGLVAPLRLIPRRPDRGAIAG